jgi:DNA-binding transcriptional LysR family regulator
LECNRINNVNVNRIDLNLLVVLEAIYDKGGITRAAEALNVTQPAISHALGRLRTLFDDPLFVREGHTMVPTPFTRSLIGPLRHSLRALAITLNEVKRFDPATSERRFTLGSRDILETTVLPRLMRSLAVVAPQVDLASVHFSRREAEADLLSGRLDAVVDVVLPDSREIRHRVVMKDGLAVVARRGHPVVAGGLDLATYLSLDHILVTSRRTGSGVADLELSRRGLQRHVALRCQHYYAAWRVVSETDLVLTIPERLALVMNPGFGNQILPSPLDIPNQDIFLYWHANVDNDPASRWLREQLAQAFAP